MSPSRYLDLSPQQQGKQFQRPEFRVSREFPSESGGIRTLPDLIDFNSKHNPDHLFAVQEVRKAGKHVGLTTITFQDLRDAVQGAIRLIRTKISSSPVDGEVAPVALFVESDIVLFVYLAALLYIDAPVLLLSIRLSHAAIAHLLNSTSAQAIIVSQTSQTTIGETIKELSAEQNRSLKQITTESYDALLQLGRKDQNATVSRRVDSCDRVGALILHSSGTTGLPKPIRLAHRYILGYAACHRLQPDQCVQRLTLSTLPMYHGFGLLAPSLSLSTGNACSFLSTRVVPSAPSVYELIERSGATSLMTVPSILEDFVSSQAYLESLARMEFVAVGGGALKAWLGEHLSTHGIKLLNHYGATEIGAIAPIFFPDDSYDWHYLRLRTDMGLELEQKEEKGENGESLYQLTGYPFGWDAPFVVQDILERRPDSEFMEVKILGRQDDLIVLSTGEKLRPQGLEAALGATTGVKTAVVFGQHQPETGVLVEPSSPLRPDEEEAFVDHVWNVIAKENIRLDRHARIGSRSMILLKLSNKSVPLSDKGSVMRKETYHVFQEEIKRVYQQANIARDDIITLATEPGQLERDLHRLVQKCAQDRVAQMSFGNDDDFFALGLDSLEATRIARSLDNIENKSDFPRLSHGAVKPILIYQNPSIAALARALRSDTDIPTDGLNPDTTQLMMRLVSSFSRAQEALISPRKTTVLLTGSTGHLGVYLLQQLCLDPQVAQIVCFNRSYKANLESSAVEAELNSRQHEANTARRIDLSPTSWSKVRFLPSNHIDQPQIGLSATEYHRLTIEVTHIIHCAWPMDFQRGLMSFTPQIAGVRNLINLALDCSQAQRLSPQRPRFLFLSSIAVAAQSLSRPIVREEPLLDPRCPSALGYAQAKWVCEQVLLNSMRQPSSPAEFGIIRLGQMSGGTESGIWNPKEHLPSLLRLSQHIGALPAMDGTYSWIPADVAARTVLDISFAPAEGRGGKAIYHVENPIRQPWRPLLPALAMKLGLGNGTPLPFQQWIERVATSDLTDEDKELFSHLKPFLEAEFQTLSTGGIILDTTESRKVSRALRTCNGVGLDLVDKYLGHWKAAGILQ